MKVGQEYRGLRSGYGFPVQVTDGKRTVDLDETLWLFYDLEDERRLASSGSAAATRDLTAPGVEREV